MKTLIKISPIVAIAAPAVAFAQNFDPTYIRNVLNFFSELIGWAVPIIIALAVVYFLWGLLKFVTSGGDEEKRKQAQTTMIYGVIVLFVMVSVWGLVKLLQNITGVNQSANPNAPDVPTVTL